jgi:acetyl-CoA C-acetyltransferase
MSLPGFPMNEAVIVSTARTPIGRAYRGAFNDTEAPVLGGHVIRAALAKAGVDGADVDDVDPRHRRAAGHAGLQPRPLCTYTAGLPESVGGMTIDRMCASGLVAIASAAKSIMVGEHRTSRGRRAGVDLADAEQAQEQPPRAVAGRAGGDAHRLHPDDRDRRDRGRALRHQPRGAGRVRAASQQRTAAAQRAGLFDDEIVPLASVKQLFDKEGNPPAPRRDAGAATKATAPTPRSRAWPSSSRCGRTASGWPRALHHRRQCLAAVRRRLASVLMSRAEAERAACARWAPTAAWRWPAAGPTRWASARCSPSPSCCRQHGLTVGDIGLWEINEAFACQVLYCRDRLGIPNDRLNVNGGAIAIGHPFGMSGARLVGHALLEGAGAA